jgi:hypothetical protein
MMQHPETNIPPYYKGQRPYRAAILETDRAQLLRHIAEANAAIKARIEALNEDHGGTPEERMAIDSALGSLSVLRKEAEEFRAPRRRMGYV